MTDVKGQVALVLGVDDPRGTDVDAHQHLVGIQHEVHLSGCPSILVLGAGQFDYRPLVSLVELPKAGLQFSTVHDGKSPKDMNNLLLII